MTAQPIEQRRILKTAIPGPRSQALHARKLASVSTGVSTGLPILSLIHISEPTRPY